MSDFGSRIRPEEVTPEVRQHMVRDSYVSELLSLAAVVVAGIVLALGFSLIYRWHGESPGAELPSIYPLLAICAVVLIAVHLWYRRDRQFLSSAPAAPAEVERLEASEDITQSHRLVIKFRPSRTDQNEGAAFATQPGDVEVVAALHSDSVGFNEELHPGDKVAVIYDPRHPEHVRVVEEEHGVGKAG